MSSLDILSSNTLNLKNKITKIEQKKIFCDPSKILKNISWSIKYMPTIFHDLHKIPPAPPLTYLMCGP